MKTQKAGSTGLDISRIAFGAMQIGGGWDRSAVTESTVKKAEAAVEAALDAGITFFDHADFYCFGKSEDVFGRVLKNHPGWREQMWIQSKTGIRLAEENSTHCFDFSAKHIRESAEESLRRMNIEQLDSLLLHRPDPLIEPEIVADVFDDLHKEGKVRYYGVSNHTPVQIDFLKRYLNQPLVFNQIRFNAVYSSIITLGVDAAYSQTDPPGMQGTIEYARLNGITLQAFNPVMQGYLCSKVPQAGGQYFELSSRLEAVQKIAADLSKKYQCSTDAVVLSWILHHPAKIQAVIGTTNHERVRASAEAMHITISREEWYQIWEAARGMEVP